MLECYINNSILRFIFIEIDFCFKIANVFIEIFNENFRFDYLFNLISISNTIQVKYN